MMEPTSLVVADDTVKGNSHRLWLERFRLDFGKISLSGGQCRETVGSPSLVFSKTWRGRVTGDLI